MRLSIYWLVSATLVISQVRTNRANAQITPVANNPIKFDWVDFSGPRPVINVSMNGTTPVQLMVHSNASAFVTTIHAVAEQLLGHPVAKEKNYGFGRNNEQSDKGRGTMTLKQLQVGERTYTDVTCPVFDLGESPVKGMLGLEWLLTSEVIIDFATQTIYTPDRQPATDLIRQLTTDKHYTAFPLTEQKNRRLTIDLKRTPADTLVGRFIVSTVADNTMDIEYARQAHIPFDSTNSTGIYKSPNGTKGKSFDGKDLTFYADGQLFKHVSLTIYDIYDYMQKSREKANGVVGYLGATFMIEHKAIIDFGGRMLYVQQ